jgi:anaerobic carbon-monoxide dehydrogenase iron sulfur subunit
MTQVKALAIDWSKCTGCGVCELVCSFTHEGLYQPSLSRIRVYRIDHLGVHYPNSCLDCNIPLCVVACPTNACHTDHGVPVVRVDPALCIGCRECVAACPFGAAHYNPATGKAYQCDLCGGEPACLPNCFPGALHYETMDRVAERKGRSRAELLVLASISGSP